MLFLHFMFSVTLAWTTAVIAAPVEGGSSNPPGWRFPPMPGQSPEEYRQGIQQIESGRVHIPRYMTPPEPGETDYQYWDRQQARALEVQREADEELGLCVRDALRRLAAESTISRQGVVEIIRTCDARVFEDKDIRPSQAIRISLTNRYLDELSRGNGRLSSLEDEEGEGPSGGRNRPNAFDLGDAFNTLKDNTLRSVKETFGRQNQKKPAGFPKLGEKPVLRKGFVH